MSILSRFKSGGSFPLPDWAEWSDRPGERTPETATVVVYPHKVYPIYLRELQVIQDASQPFANKDRITPFWLEVAMRCASEDLRRWAIVHGAPGLHVRWVRDLDWKLTNFKGANADHGRSVFRVYYNQLRQLRGDGHRFLEIPQIVGKPLVWKDGFPEPTVPIYAR